MAQPVVLHEVLTLEEVAEYLRLPRDTVERQALQGQFPGRQIEGNWRFLKAAIDDWLQRADSRAVLLRQAGALAGDGALAEIRRSIYVARGRSEQEEGEGQ